MSIVFSCFTGPLLQALSKPHYLAMLEWGRMVVGTVLVVGAGLLVRNSSVDRQLLGIALARCATMACVVAPVFLSILMHLGKFSLRDLASAVAPSVLASMSAVAVVLLFQFSGWLGVGKPLFLLSAEVAVGGITGLTVLLALDTQLYGMVTSLPQKMFRSFSESRA
jgi:hypothetical protein